jgi:CRISPR type III-A-associated RAMP protein Csm5
MRVGETLDLRIETVTPVLIGSGERLSQMDFLIMEGKVHVIDRGRFISALSRGQRDRFVRWVEEVALSSKYPPGIYKFLSDLRRERRGFDRRRLLEGCISYSMPYTFAPTNRAGYPYMTGINTCLKTPDHRPYIPGSELKGTIRTAILVKMLEDENALKRLAQAIGEITLKNSRKQIRGDLRDRWQRIERELLRGKGGDAHYDLLRGLWISDTSPLPRETLRVEATEMYGTSRKTLTFVETISRGEELTARVTLTSPERWLEELGLSDKDGWLSWERILQAIHFRSTMLLDLEADRFKADERMREEVERLKRLNLPDSPLLPVGGGQGFMGITFTLPLKRMDEEGFEDLRRALAKAYGQYSRTSPHRFPKTRRVVLNGKGRPSTFLGWVKLITGRR